MILRPTSNVFVRGAMLYWRVLLDSHCLYVCDDEINTLVVFVMFCCY